MIGFSWFMIFLAVFCVLAYQRASLIIWKICFGLLLILATRFHHHTFCLSLFWLFYLAVFIPFTIKPINQRFISQRLLNFFVQLCL